MQLSVSLDGSKRRDLRLFQGDTVTLAVTVYAEDGDTVPIVPTNIRFADGDGFAYGAPFTVPDNVPGRSWYRLVGEVAGVTTTLAFGYIQIDGLTPGWPCGCPCDGYWRAP